MPIGTHSSKGCTLFYRNSTTLRAISVYSCIFTFCSVTKSSQKPPKLHCSRIQFSGFDTYITQSFLSLCHPSEFWTVIVRIEQRFVSFPVFCIEFLKTEKCQNREWIHFVLGCFLNFSWLNQWFFLPYWTLLYFLSHLQALGHQGEVSTCPYSPPSSVYITPGQKDQQASYSLIRKIFILVNKQLDGKLFFFP